MCAIRSQLDGYTTRGAIQPKDSSDCDRYEPIHATVGCKCKLVRLGNDALNSAAKNGRAVIVSVDESNPASPLRKNEIDLSQPNEETRFIAISHVRAEGLGNSMDSLLPLCQIRLLQTYANNLEGTETTEHVLFWIDSLCVPSNKRTKKVAVRNLRQVFTQAWAVLVLDPTIMQSTSISTDEERLSIIGTSAWPTRLWTLQEGAVAKRLFFQFRDGATKFQDLVVSGHPGLKKDSHQAKSRLLGQICLFGDDLKMEEFPRPFRYGHANEIPRPPSETHSALLLTALPADAAHVPAFCDGEGAVADSKHKTRVRQSLSDRRVHGHGNGSC